MYAVAGDKLVGGRIVSKMDRQPHNRRKFFMDGELEQLDDGLRRTDVAGLQMHLNLVQPVLPPYLNCCFIRSFVNIFVDIFYSLDRGADLDINMSIVFTGEIRVVKDNKTVIKMDLLSADGMD